MSEQILPFYLVCDESGSMSHRIDMMNTNLLPDLHTAIAEDPIVSDKTRFAVIGFADDARLTLPLSDLSDLDSMPGLVARGATSYGDAFRLLKETITDDITRLKAQGGQVYRPAVFFLSDGQPSDDNWRKQFSELTSENFKFRPNMIAFGFEENTDGAIIAEVGTFRAFTIDGTVSPAVALKEFAVALTKSIVKSGNSATSTGITLQVPTQIPGFTSLHADEL